MTETYHTGGLGGSGGTDEQFIPEIWSKEVQLARESNLVMSGLVRRMDSDAGYGDIIHIPNITNLTAGNINTGTGVLDASANTETATDLTINKWKGICINVLDCVQTQSKYDILSIYTEKMGYALGVIVEQDLLGLAASITNTTGTYNTSITDAVIRTSVQYLDDARVPFSDRHFIFKPSVKNTILSIDKFVRYDGVSYSTGQSPILKGNVGELYGVMCHVSPEVIVASSTNTQNLMFHRECLGLAMQKDVKIEKFARTDFTDRLGGSELYGIGILRNDHGVLVKT